MPLLVTCRTGKTSHRKRSGAQQHITNLER
jgi:hypothetical protein